MPQNRSMHVQERPGRAAAPCLCPPSSLAASRRVAFVPATMASFLFVFENKSFVAMYREGRFDHIVTTAQDDLLEDRKHTDRVGYRTNDLAKQWIRGQSAGTPRARAVRVSFALAKRRLHHPVHTGSSLRGVIARPSSCVGVIRS